MSEVSLAPDGERVLREAQNFCFRANVAIVAAEHLLAGALLVLSEAGNSAVPTKATLEAALMLTQAEGDTAHANQVMFGSAARDALNAIAAGVRQGGGRLIDARAIALGTIDSGEVNPMFYGSLGVERAALRGAVAG